MICLWIAGNAYKAPLPRWREKSEATINECTTDRRGRCVSMDEGQEVSYRTTSEASDH